MIAFYRLTRVSRRSTGVIIFPLLFDREHFRDFMIEPTPARMAGGHRIYRYVFAGFVFFVVVSRHRVPAKFERVMLGVRSPVRVFPKELRDFSFLRSVWNLAAETTKDVVL